MRSKVGESCQSRVMRLESVALSIATKNIRHISIDRILINCKAHCNNENFINSENPFLENYPAL